MSSENEAIFKGLLEKIEETERLITDCKSLPEICGRSKLRRKIEAELRFLKRLTEKPEKLKEEHIRSSNIYHLSAIVQSCRDMPGVVKVLETFTYVIEETEDDVYEIPIVVDIVADYGKTWVKVATRNPIHLYQASIGRGKYGRKSIVEQIEDMIDCASQNQHMFASPKIIVRLAAGVTKELKALLDELKVEVIGDIVGSGSEDTVDLNDCDNELESSSRTEVSSIEQLNLNDEKDFSEISSTAVSFESNLLSPLSLPIDAVLNLDVSTFLAYVSNMTNGHCHAKYNEKLLMDLAAMERANPVKPVLDDLFKNRKLVCCETAHRDFLEILSTVGGASEKQRASDFLKRVEVIPDDASPKALYLEKTSKIKERSKVVFGTGDTIKAVTVSANFGFLRAAQSQGIKFVAFLHESRALTECKELKNENNK